MFIATPSCDGIVRLLLLALFFLSLPIEHSLADEVRVVAHIGDSLPDGNGGYAQISALSSFPNAAIPQISESGHAVFMAQVTGNGISSSNNTGIWRIGPDSQPELIARSGTGVWAPGSGLFFNRFFTPKINSIGQSAFGAELGGTDVTTSNTRSFWTPLGSSQLLLAREGTNAPIGSGVTLGSFSDQHLKYTSGGGIFTLKTALLGSGITSSNNRAFWKTEVGSGTLTLLAQAGAPIPGMGSLTCKEPYRLITDNGQILMYSTLSGAGIVTDPGTGVPVIPNDQVIWIPGASDYLVRSGTLAPGLTHGEHLTSLFSTILLNRRPRINAHGQIAFAANFSDANGNPIGTGIWTNRSGSFAAVVKTGDIAPGFPAGSAITAPLIGSNSYIFADDGSVVFTSYVSNSQIPSSSQLAIFKNSVNGETQLIYSTNQQAPGAAAGVLISDSVAISNLRLNSNGEIIFVAELTGPGVDATNKMAVFQFNNGTLRMVTRQGDLIPDSGGWRIGGIVSEPLIYFNNAGQMLFAVSATEGPTGYGLGAAWLRVDVNGNVRAFAISNEIVPNQVGPRVRMGSLSLNALMSFNDAGEIALQNSLAPGGDISGESIVVIRIVNEPSANLCLADFNSDGTSTIQDLFDFLAAWFALDPRADFNHQGGIAVQDLFDFLAAWFEGCG